MALPVRAEEGLSGAYLAARSAAIANDYAAAAQYYTLALADDPGHPVLMEFTVLSQLSLGDLDAALGVARQMQEAGIQSQIAAMVILADQVQRDAWEEVLNDFTAGPRIGPLVDGLALAWAQFGLGRMSEALETFDRLAQERGIGGLALLHKAFALASVGDFEGAEQILSGESGPVLRATRRGVIAYAQVLSQLDRFADGVALIDATFGPQSDEEMMALRARLEAGESIAFDIVHNPREGLAEAFLGLAGALSGEADNGYTLIYARMAQALRPDLSDALLMVAGLLEAQQQYDLAIAAYESIPVQSPAYAAATMGRAEALYRSGQPEAALATMQALVETHANNIVAHVVLGDMLRRVDRFDEATLAYDQAIALIGAPQPQHWVVFYSRGISHERAKRWDKAEADFRRALELSPDQPQVLNYLGYSFVDMGTNLDEALALIERAVAARPRDGYIIDSLGWAYYRLGRYAEAVTQMERAAELEAVDPIVNDHLGDVLWAVGRKLEAEFQWRRALSFGPEEQEALRIRRKLEVGLDKVLEEEGAPPLGPAPRHAD